VPYKYASYAPNCAACHAGDYKQGDHKKFGNTTYTVSELRDCSGSCHEYTDATLSKVKTYRSSHHRVSSSEF
jgi:hypothetical protein